MKHTAVENGQGQAEEVSAAVADLSSDDLTEYELGAIRDAVKDKYRKVAISPAGLFKYPTGKDGLETLGYDLTLVANYPEQLFGSFCGVGNHFAEDNIRKGDTVLDIGCGAGVDLLFASQLVGEEGHVYGIDCTDAMLDAANHMVENYRLTNITTNFVATDDIPYSDEMFDVVMSNGVFNLFIDKLKLFKEIHRVLKPGGILQFADIVARAELAGPLSARIASWSQ